MALPKTTQDRIEDEAAHYVDQAHVYIGDDIHQAYIAGANAEAERWQKMITDIENIIKHSKGSSESVYVNVLIDSLTKKLAEWKGAGKGVELTCMVCGEKFMGPEPKMCCSGRDCGCMGLPVEPIVCSKECYEKGIPPQKGDSGGTVEAINDPCPHCGKELSRDRNLCCRECGKEVQG